MHFFFFFFFALYTVTLTFLPEYHFSGLTPCFTKSPEYFQLSRKTILGLAMAM